MDAITYFNNKSDLCGSVEFCINCPLCRTPDWRCYEMERYSPQEAVEILTKWMEGVNNEKT